MNKDTVVRFRKKDEVVDPLVELLVHIRTSNPIESTFATVRHRTERTKGCVSRASLLGLVFKLAMSAEQGWRRLRGFERLGELVDGVKFVDGISSNKIKRTQVQPQQAAA